MIDRRKKLISITEELNKFQKKTLEGPSRSFEDLYGVMLQIKSQIEKIDNFEDKIEKIDKVGKRSIISIESLKDELEEVILERQQLKNSNLREEKCAKKIIVVLDEIENLYRFAIQSQNESLMNNMKSMMKLIRKNLREIGFEEIPTVGEIFNAELHECVEAKVCEDKVQYEIIDVVKKGYRLNEKILRVAYVIAAK